MRIKSLKERRASRNGSRVNWKLSRCILFLGLATTVGFVIACSTHDAFADEMPVVYMSGTLAENRELTDDNVYVVEGTVNVPNGISLTIDGGTTVKFTSSSSNQGIKIASGGSLTAQGTAGSPVVFTSMKDDTAGGDTNGDGSSTSPAVGNYNQAINAQSGSNVTIQYATFRYGWSGLQRGCNGSSETGNLSVEDSIFNSAASISGCDTDGAYTMQRNQFNVDGADAAVVISSSSPSGFLLSGVNKNTFTGTNNQLVLRLEGVTLPSNVSWNLDGLSSGAVVESQGIQVNGSLTISAGTVIKGLGSTRNLVSIMSNGSADIQGTAIAPVVFTSMKDDTVGGDTNGDGGSTTPSLGNYNQAMKSLAGSSVTVEHALFRYGWFAISGQGSEITARHSLFSNVGFAVDIQGGEATVEDSVMQNITGALQANDGHARLVGAEIDQVSGSPAVKALGSAFIVVRADFSNLSGRAIESCNWGTTNQCSVDAAYSNWGSSNGPFAVNSNDNLVCGAVTVSPWSYNASDYTSSDLFDVKNCNSTSVPSVALSSNAAYFSSRVAARNIDCSNGFQDACAAINNAYACLNSAISVASGSSPFPLPGSSPTGAAATYVGDVINGASVYMNSIEYRSPTGFGLSLASNLYGLVGTVASISNAYNSCAP